MEITVSSRHVEVPAALKAVAVDKIGRLSRFLDDMDRAEVHFFAEKNPRIENREVCEVTMEGHGHHVRARVAAQDQFAAIDAAVAKLEHQLHRLKSRLVGRQKGKGGAKAVLLDAVEVLPSTPAPPEPSTTLVKRKLFEMKPMSVEEAMLQRELLGHDFFVFLLAESNQTAVLYGRDDGDIGLIEVAPAP